MERQQAMHATFLYNPDSRIKAEVNRSDIQCRSEGQEVKVKQKNNKQRKQSQTCTQENAKTLDKDEK